MTTPQFLAGSNLSTTTSKEVDFSLLIDLHLSFPRELALAGQAERFLSGSTEADKWWKFLGEVRGDVKKTTYHDDLLLAGHKLLEHGNESLLKRFIGHYYTLSGRRQQLFRDESKEWPPELIAAICKKSDEASQGTKANGSAPILSVHTNRDGITESSITRSSKRQKRCENTGLETSDHTQTSNQGKR